MQRNARAMVCAYLTKICNTYTADTNCVAVYIQAFNGRMTGYWGSIAGLACNVPYTHVPLAVIEVAQNCSIYSMVSGAGGTCMMTKTFRVAFSYPTGFSSVAVQYFSLPVSLTN